MTRLKMPEIANKTARKLFKKTINGALLRKEEIIILKSYILDLEKRQVFPHLKKVRGKTAHIFWDCIFKGIITAGLYAVGRYISTYAKPIEIPYRLENIEKISKEICTELKFKGLGKERIIQASRIAIYFVTIDTFYSQFFEKFVKKYYEKFYKK